MKHTFLLLDPKLKALAMERRWKEYNSFCSLLCNNNGKKTDIIKLRNWADQGLIENRNNICAICLNHYNFCIVY